MWIGGLAAALSGCAVGPDFVRPAPPSVQGYTAAGPPEVLASTTGGGSQRLHLGEEISADWWALFRSPALAGVVREALAGSPTLAAARATLAAAEENVAAARGGFFPQLDLSASLERSRASALRSGGRPIGGRSAGGPTTNLYSLGPTVSYPLDVFGGTRRKVEQQRALAEHQAYELAAAYLTLTGNAVTEGITIASVRAQIQATEEIIAEDERNLSLVRREFAAGKVARAHVLSAETQLAGDRAALPALLQQLSSWNLAANLTAPLFHGGTLEAERRGAVDTYRASLATYEQTVLQAFQQVADSLQALAHDAEQVDAERQLLEAARAALDLQRQSYEAGKTNILQLIDAERSYQQARLGSAKADAQLLVALGGAWSKANL